MKSMKLKIFSKLKKSKLLSIIIQSQKLIQIIVYLKVIYNYLKMKKDL
jgi:hypothetical protein